MRSLPLWIVCVVGAITLSGCSVSRRIPQGEYLLTKNTITINQEQGNSKEALVAHTDLENYVRQQPNSRFLGTYFPVWLYLQADPEKNNGWNRAKRRLGAAPVLLDTTLVESSARGINIYMDGRGFLNSTCDFTIDTLRKKARVSYHVDQGKPYYLGQINYKFQDDFVAGVILSDTAKTLLHTGDIFDINTLDQERVRITEFLKSRGYYTFSVGDIRYVADTTPTNQRVDLTMIVRQYRAGFNEQGQPILENNQVYRLGEISVFADYNPTLSTSDTAYFAKLDTLEYQGLQIIYDKHSPIYPKILRQTVNLTPNQLYDVEQVKETYDNVMRLGYYKSANILFSEQAADSSSNLITYVGSPQAVDSITYAEERYLTCSIYCVPTTRQSVSVELEGTSTSDYLGMQATLGYKNRNVFHSAGMLDVEFTGGYEFYHASSGKRNAFEIGGSAALTFPKMITPFRVNRHNQLISPHTRVEMGYNVQRRPYYHRELSDIELGYGWGVNKKSSFELNPIDVSVVRLRDVDADYLESLENPYLQNSYISQVIAGISGSYIYNSQPDNPNRNALTIRINAETNGNLIGSLYKMLDAQKYTESSSDDSGESDSYYRLFGVRFAQYVRYDINLAQRIKLSPKSSLVYRFYNGWGYAYGNSSSIPFERLFYAGGANSMRGWLARCLGPGTTPNTSASFDDYPSQLGNFKLEANLEARFPVWGFLQGALFLDAGNVWFASQGYDSDTQFRFDNFYKQLGFNTGIGMRFDFSFFVFRVDWGIQLHNPNYAAGSRWVIKNFSFDNSALHFGVGYPF